MAVDLRGHPMAAVLASISGAGLVGIGVWQLSEQAPPAANPTAASAGNGAASVEQTAEVALAADEPSVDPPAPDTMQARLLTTTEGNRNNIFSLTLASAGYECPEIRTARAVGRDGSNWRIQCGESWVYSVEVDEFGRLSVYPVPYGDIRGSQVPVQRDFESGGRTIILPAPE
jgi:hypothetical protein